MALCVRYGSFGSVVALLNNSGSVVEGYSYDPFGKPTVHTAAGADGKWLTSDDTTAANAVSAYGNWQMFTARQWDKESGLYYYRARMYHPQLGRFLQPDPIGYYDSMNLYQYCLNNPVDWTDPYGLYNSRTQLEDEVWKEDLKSGKGCGPSPGAKDAADGILKNGKPGDNSPFKKNGRNWYNENTGESVSPPDNHGHGNHSDYHRKGQNPKNGRIYPNGKFEPK